MKSNKELNTEHDRRMQERVRPKSGSYNFKPLDAVIRKWVEASRVREQT